MRRGRNRPRAPLLGDHQPVSGKIGAGISAGSHLETGVPPAAEQGVPRGANWRETLADHFRRDPVTQQP